MLSPQNRQMLKNLAEYGPLVVFFVLYYTNKDLFWATGGLLIATVISVLLTYYIERRLPFLPIFTAFAVGIFGGLTLILQDDLFIKIRPTVVNIIFGLVLLIGLVKNKLFLKILLSKALQISDYAWRIMTIRWSIFFFILALLNEIVWRTQDEEFWVNYKVFGVMLLNFFFLAFHIPFIQRNQIKETTLPDKDNQEKP